MSLRNSRGGSSFGDSHSWSSSVINNLRAWKIYFGDGAIMSYDNKSDIDARCLRRE